MDNKLTRKAVLTLICILPLTLGCILTNIARSALSDGQETSPTIQIQVETEPAEETVPTVEVSVPTIEPAETVPTEEKAQDPAHETICTDVDELRICIPQGLADNLVVSTIPEFTAEMGAPWDVAPEHRLIDLQGYLITNAFWKPQIIIYPIEAYKATSPDEINTLISDLDALLAQKPDQINNTPFLPFVNAASILDARPVYYDDETLSVRGYSVLTQFGQSFWPVNNKDMFYTFQGMTTDRKYWITMTLPVTQQDLPANGDYITSQDFEKFANDFPTYIANVREAINQADPATFNPTLDKFDLIINDSFSKN